jgi:tripartite-type tricarboxylate transporter receptor subunit TctC
MEKRMPLARRHFLEFAAAAFAIPHLSLPAFAQSYPARPVKVIVPVGPGGANDTSSRLIAQKLSESMGQQFYVENLAGGGGNIGIAAAAKSAPDGYTLLSAAPSFFINPSLYAKIPYDPFADFAPVTLVCATTHVIAVHPSLPVNSVQELIALAKANPGKYSYGSAGAGTPAHLAGELFKVSFGLDITHVPFGGGGPALTSTIGGHTPIAFSALSTAAPNVKAGTVRALAVMSGRRSSLLPDVPTMAEAGAPGQEADVITGILVRAGTSKEIIERLHGEIARAMGQPDARERMAALGFEPVNNTPDEFAVWIKTEIAKWAKVVRAANLQIQ